jgi:hypothetical protein
MSGITMDAVIRDARRLRIGRDITSRSTLGAILPLHDVRYHALALKPRGSITDAKRFLCERAEKQPPGGARRDRTDDLLLAKQALSQLSYGPDRISDRVIAEIGGPGKT